MRSSPPAPARRPAPRRRQPPRRRRRRSAARARFVVFAVVLLGLVALGSLLGRDERLGRDVAVVPTPPGTEEGEATTEVEDPFAWADDRKADFERRAAAGNANVLYRFSPGGAAATARRTARWRSDVEAAARAGGADPDLVEALVFLESGGREDALTGAGVTGAAGLGQIVAGTARELLGMHVDVARSRHLTRRIERERRRGHAGKVRALEADRRRADERFDPAKALAATGRYLAIAQRRFGRDDLALESYHMGIGNLEGVLRAFTGERSAPIAEVVRDEELSWAEVYFDSTPRRHVAAHQRLRAFSDDSSNYYWKLLAARDVMALWREDPRRLDRLARAHTRKNSAEEVLHPPGETTRFATPAALRRAWDDDRITALPDRPAVTGLARDASMGSLAGRLGQPAGLYRGLTPAALAVALYIGAEVRAVSRAAPLTVTSTVRDERYQRLLVRSNREATRNYSLHTTGWAFDVARLYDSRAQALAFQATLDRLQALNVIAWVREPQAIHITASADGEALLPLLERIGG